jgi:hypothetical protein
MQSASRDYEKTQGKQTPGAIELIYMSYETQCLIGATLLIAAETLVGIAIMAWFLS